MWGPGILMLAGFTRSAPGTSAAALGEEAFANAWAQGRGTQAGACLQALVVPGGPRRTLPA